MFDLYSFTLLHSGGAWRLAVLSGAAAAVPLVAATLRWPALGSGTTDWYPWVSDPGSARMGRRGSSSGVGRHDDTSCHPSEVSLLLYCNTFSEYVYLYCVCEMGAHEHIHVHVDEILVWTWASRVGFCPPSAAYMRQCTWLSVVQVMACRLVLQFHTLLNIAFRSPWFIVLPRQLWAHKRLIRIVARTLSP